MYDLFPSQKLELTNYNAESVVHYSESCTVRSSFDSTGLASVPGTRGGRTPEYPYTCKKNNVELNHYLRKRKINCTEKEKPLFSTNKKCTLN